jgi:hypothetical protein
MSRDSDSGGVVFATDNLAAWTPARDAPAISCFGCPGVSKTGCCQYRAPVNPSLSLTQTQPRRSGLLSRLYGLLITRKDI